VGFQEKPIDYTKWLAELQQIPSGLHHPQMRAFCQEKMVWHISTAERLPILASFYGTCLAAISPIHSLLDLASGLNPLAYSWLNLANDASVTSVDIYQDQADFLNQFYAYNHLNGRALVADITHSLPEGTFDLALLLKTIPCLEQVDRGIGRRLLTSINARHILVTFRSQPGLAAEKACVQRTAPIFKKLSPGSIFLCSLLSSLAKSPICSAGRSRSRHNESGRTGQRRPQPPDFSRGRKLAQISRYSCSGRNHSKSRE
jgi:hypothetical protein